MTMPATSAIAGIMYGSTVMNSMNVRIFGNRRWVQTAVGTRSTNVNNTVPSASVRLSFSAGMKSGSSKARQSGSSDHFFRIVSLPSRNAGTFCSECRANVSNGSRKKNELIVTTMMGTILLNRALGRPTDCGAMAVGAVVEAAPSSGSSGMGAPIEWSIVTATATVLPDDGPPSTGSCTPP
jgi:hypothetical protein